MEGEEENNQLGMDKYRKRNIRADEPILYRLLPEQFRREKEYDIWTEGRLFDATPSQKAPKQEREQVPLGSHFRPKDY